MKNVILLATALFFVTGALAQTSEQDEAKKALVKSIKEDVKNNESVLKPKGQKSSGSIEDDYNNLGISGETYERFKDLNLSKSPKLRSSSRSSSRSSGASSGTSVTTRRNVTRSANSNRVGGAARVRVNRSGGMSDEARAARREAAEARRAAELENAYHDAEMRHEFMNAITTDNLRKIAVYSDPSNRPKLSAEELKKQKRGYSGNYIEEEGKPVRESVNIRAGIDNKRSGEELWQIYRSSGKLTKDEEGRLSEWLKSKKVEY